MKWKVNKGRIAAQITDERLDGFFSIADRASVILAVLAIAGALLVIILPALMKMLME